MASMLETCLNFSMQPFKCQVSVIAKALQDCVFLVIWKIYASSGTAFSHSFIHSLKVKSQSTQCDNDFCMRRVLHRWKLFARWWWCTECMYFQRSALLSVRQDRYWQWAGPTCPCTSIVSCMCPYQRGQTLWWVHCTSWPWQTGLQRYVCVLDAKKHHTPSQNFSYGTVCLIH